ncbi:O-methyltransferase [Fastidiosibacter lacustris]|uniref:O-methyltransferase n=1 Tax=Fastidiosibacter lacustris TaxID=2056695 RepID=UPI000E352423|nr:class I SAM-dependent methyltransferase [Fastidiosibacter lacustris]
MSLDTLLKEQALHQYILDNTPTNSNIQKKLFEHARQDQHAQMITAPEQLHFMQLLIRLINAKKTIEVGVFRGVGTLAIAEALPQDGIVYACDVTDEYLNEYKTFWHQANVAHKIQLKIAPASDTLQLLIDQNEGNSFDFIYIDADKGGYLDYYAKSYKLLKTNGIMVLDNMLRNGKVADPNVVNESIQTTREVNQMIKDDQRVDASLLPIGDGVTIVRKK